MRRVKTEANLFNNNEIQRSNTSNLSIERTFKLCKIESPTDGIPLEYIASKTEILAGLICSICQNLVWDPVEFENCSHTFCFYCIKKSLEKFKFCPICKQKSIKLRPCKTYSRLCGEIKIKCKNSGCKETPSYSNYIEHLQKCNFKKYMCLNEGCIHKGTKQEAIEHSLVCEFRIIDCQYCHNPVKYCEFEKHSKTVCTQEYKCQFCKEKMERGKYFSQHFSENGDNINCLKAQVRFYKRKSNNLDKQMKNITEKFQKEKNEMPRPYEEKISILTIEKDKLLKENELLKEEAKNAEDLFESLYNQIRKRKSNNERKKK